MPPRARALVWSNAAGLAAIAAALTVAPATPATAAGLFDFLFGGARPAPPPVYRDHHAPNNARRYDRSYDGGYRRAPERETVTSRDPEPSGAPRVAYCVRLCDGRYFPISSGRTAAVMCNSLCPASPTQLFYGRQIDSSRDRHGRAYSKLENAFVYRTKIVPSCTCNGRAGFGVARVPLDHDPTLRKGDIVARPSGLSVYTAKRAASEPAFTPIDQAKLSKRVRKELEGVKIAPRPTPATADAAEAKPRAAASTSATTWQTQALSVHKTLRLTARAQ